MQPTQREHELATIRKYEELAEKAQEDLAVVTAERNKLGRALQTVLDNVCEAHGLPGNTEAWARGLIRALNDKAEGWA